ncbi:hypothetical protein [Streptomyces sp. NPDC050504]|uniref:hypothetical protein n=1 Tax=Streptomyces sp. NPDC050504 TaxID=3365618 RepID=UPI003789D8B4
MERRRGAAALAWMRRGGGLDRGASGVDYLGSIVVVVAIVLGLSAAGIGGQVADAIQAAICRATGGGNCDVKSIAAPGDKPLDNKKYEPKVCNTSSVEDVAGAEATIGFFSIGNEYGFQEQEFKTPEGDTKVYLTFTDAASVKAKKDVKAGVKVGKLGGDKVELGGGIKVTNGDTWVFNNKQEAKELREKVERLQALETQITHGGNANMGYGLMGIFGKGPYAEMDRLTKEINSKLDGGHITFGKIGAEVTGDAALKKAQKDEKGLGLQLGGKFKLAPEATVTNNNATKPPTKGYTYQFTLEYAGTANLSLGPLSDKVEKGQIRTGTMTVMRYPDGSLARVDMTQSIETRKTENGKITGDKDSKTDVDKDGKPKKNKGSAQTTDKDRETHVTTNTIAFPPPGDKKLDAPGEAEKVKRNRETVENWLDGSGNNVAPFVYLFGDKAPKNKADAQSDFEKLMYEEGVSSYQRFSGTTEAEEYGFEVNLGLTLGAKVSFEHTNMKLEQADFLGAPKPDGKREYMPYSYCAK